MEFDEALKLVRHLTPLAALKTIRSELGSGLKDTWEFVQAAQAEWVTRAVPSAELLNQFTALSREGQLQILLNRRQEALVEAVEHERMAAEAYDRVAELQDQINQLARELACT
jgi:hypothetical protein